MPIPRPFPSVRHHPAGLRLLLALGAFVALVPQARASSVGEVLRDSFVWTGQPEPTAAYTVFRRTFEARAATTARLDLFADARYVLWANGTRVARGPARFDPVSPEHDTLDLAPFLVAGRNTLVVLVMSYPAGTPGSSGQLLNHAPGLTARLLLGHADATTTELRTDDSWRWKTGLRYMNPRIDWGFTDDTVDLRLDDGDWTLPGYDDAAWSSAVRISGLSWGIPRTRTLPLLRETEVAVATGPTLPLALAAGQSVFLSLPRMVMATVELDLDGGTSGGGTLRVEVGLRGSSSSVSETYGNAFVATAGPARGTAAMTDSRGFRYVRVTATAGSPTLHALRVVERRFPWQDLGSFSSSDPFLDELWKRSVHTVRMNTEEGYTDAPLRERSQWMGDAAVVGYPVARATLAAPDGRSDATLLRQIVRHVASSGSLYGDGRLRANAPSNRVGTSFDTIEDYTCLWVQALREHLDHTGDTEAVVDHWETLVRSLGWFLDRRGPRGLVRAREFVIFDNPTVYTTCEGTTLNAFVYRALLDGATCADAIGQATQATAWRDAAAALRVAFDTHLWDPSSGSYHAGLDDSGTPLARGPTAHAAILALDRGIVPDAKLAPVRAFMRASHDAAIRYPYVSAWLVGNLYAMQDPARDTEVLQYFRTKWAGVLARTDTGTLTEQFNSGEASHVFGAVPARFLSTHVLGVRDDQPRSAARLLVEPRPGDLTRASGTVVTKHGAVPVDWTRTGSTFALAVTVPAATRATLAIPTDLFGTSGIGAVAINGTTVWSNGAFLGGVAGLSWEGQVGRHLRFDADSGPWSVLASADTTINHPPSVVIRGPAPAIGLPDLAATLQLDADASDVEGLLSLAWETASGPASASFANPTSANTTATFPSAGTYVLRLVGSDGRTTVTAHRTVHAGLRAIPLEFGDIGVVSVPGSHAFDGLAHAVTGQADITGTSDRCAFARVAIGGDFVVTTRVAAQTPTNAWAKAGLMARSGTEPGAPYAAVVVTVSNGVRFQHRATANASAQEQSSTGAAVPVWLRLERSGTTMIAWRSADGSSWTRVGNPVTVPLPASALVGFVVSSNSPVASTATFDRLSGICHGEDAPLVDPGSGEGAIAGSAFALGGRLLDATPATTTWSATEAPGLVNFADASSPDTTVTAAQAGLHVLRLAATRGATTVHRDRAITVEGGFRTWFQSLAGPGAAADPAADADGDGIPNLIEYALGGDALDRAARPVPTLAADAGGLRLVFEQRRTDVRYTVQGTSDLGSGAWIDLTTFAGESGTRTFMDPVLPEPGGPPRFLRLKVE